MRGRARRDQPFARADLARLGNLRAGLVDFTGLDGAGMADGANHFADADHLALREPAVELLEHRLRRGTGILRSAQRDRVAVDRGLDAEPVFEHGKVCVVVAEQVTHEPHVVEEDDGRLVAAIDLLDVARRALMRGPAPARQRCFPATGLAGHTAA